MPASENSALSDIQEVNLSYLMLAQRLLRDNYAAG
ncbi:MAG TPA: flagellar transcriptional regulator FlhD, partial [Burkholderiaceae bacterium]|nr:flagellar transcriptional regulator FlhD [Burkholderiaceae bacterium]